MRLPNVGAAGQDRLKEASVLIVGAGGLGSPVAMYLAAAGVGRIGIADGDRVEISNLHRQLLHRTEDVGAAKVESARRTLESINPHVRIDTIGQRLSRDNALDLVAAYDVIVDGTDNFPTRYLLNDACVLTARPLVYGSVDRFDGQVSIFSTSRGPCYRCLFPRPPEPGSVLNCADAGVLGVLPGLIGILQATETLKLILGLGDNLSGRLLLVDTLGARFRTVTIDRDPECPSCGTREIKELADYDAFCSGAPRSPVLVGLVTPRQLADELANREPVVLLDVRESYEWEIGRLPNARLIPLGTLLNEAPDIDRDASIVVYCHHGMRSQMGAESLV